MPLPTYDWHELSTNAQPVQVLTFANHVMFTTPCMRPNTRNLSIAFQLDTHSGKSFQSEDPWVNLRACRVIDARNPP